MLSINQLQLLPPKNWQDLENLVKDLFRTEWHDFHTQRNGRSGQAQQGVDVFGKSRSRPGWSGIQCKDKDLLIRSRLTVRELKEEIKKAKTFEPPLTEFIVATTAPRDSHLQQEARKVTALHKLKGHFSVHVYSWDDIVELLSKHDRIAAQYFGVPAGTKGGAPFLSEQTLTATLAHKDEASSNKEELGATAPMVLPAAVTQALGILATNPFDFPEEAYVQFFPDMNWKSSLPTLLAANVVQKTEAGLRVPAETKACFLPAPDDRKPFHDLWIAALEPHREHVDIAMFLAFHHLALRDYRKAMDTIVTVAAYLESGSWNKTVCDVLLAFNRPKVLKRLSAEQRLKYFHSVCLCLSRGPSPRDALPWTVRLRKEAKRQRKGWGLAQSFLLAGIAHVRTDEIVKAVAHYRQAVHYARRHRLPLTEGHALHNLAMARMRVDVDEAADLLEQSVRAKKKAGDDLGRVGAMIGRGQLAVTMGDYAKGQRWFLHAEKLSARLDMRETRSIALCNIASSFADQREFKTSIVHYKECQDLAEQEGFTETLLLALDGEARATLELKRFGPAHDCYARLHKIQEEAGAHDSSVAALHATGVCRLRQGRAGDARNIFAQALGEARKHNVVEWIYRCRKDIALSYADEGNPKLASTALRDAALEEDKNRQFPVAAKLWEGLAAFLMDDDQDPSLIDNAFTHAVSAVEEAGGTVDERIRLLSGLFECRWSALAFEGAMKVLDTIEQVARDNHRHQYVCRAIDQRGSCLQQLDKPLEAITQHRSALAIARRLPTTKLAETCLCNLGEALRKANQPVRAVKAYLEAEALAHARGDTEADLSIAHNRALALEDLGKNTEAARILRACRDTALRLGLWPEYVRALHGLANHAWVCNRRVTATRLYHIALASAKAHNVMEHIGPISLNHAYALWYRKKPKQAFAMLKGMTEHFQNLPDAHVYLAELAAMADGVGDRRAAKDYWNRARTHACLVRDSATQTRAFLALAQILEDEGRLADAEQMLKETLTQTQDPEQQVSLLAQRVRTLLKAGKDAAASKAFSTLCTIAKAHALTEDLIDAHMMIGDHEWSDGKSRLQAVKAYTVALIESFGLGLEVMFQVGAHTLQQLLSVPAENRLTEIDRVERLLHAWLIREIGSQGELDTLTVLLWPVRLSRQFAVGATKGRILSSKETTDFLRKEIFERAGGKKPE